MCLLLAVKSCFCRGDPHCKTYDGYSTSVPGGCIYALSINVCSDFTPEDYFYVLIDPDEDVPGIFTIQKIYFLALEVCGLIEKILR